MPPLPNSGVVALVVAAEEPNAPPEPNALLDPNPPDDEAGTPKGEVFDLPKSAAASEAEFDRDAVTLESEAEEAAVLEAAPLEPKENEEGGTKEGRPLLPGTAVEFDDKARTGGLFSIVLPPNVKDKLGLIEGGAGGGAD